MSETVSATAAVERLEALVRSRLPTGASAASQQRAERFFTDGIIESTQLGDMAFDNGELWHTELDRSRARFAHGFLFVVDWPHFIAQSDKSRELASRALAMTRTWEGSFPMRASEHGMAYHDETTAQRLLGHLTLLPVLDKFLSDDEIDWLHGFLDRTADLLGEDEFHAGDNNHGMFQDLAVVSYAGLARWRDIDTRRSMLAVALERLGRYFRGCFTEEGVHTENTPTYHVMVSRFVREHAELLRVIGNDDADYFEELTRRLAVYATHAVMPSGVFPPVSDTQQLPLLHAAANIYEDAEFTYAASQGRQGSRPARRVLVLPDSGYAIYRSSWGDESATYVYFHCAYNGGYHKHADENSFVLRSGGIDLISEGGPHGYNYKDRLTRYGYSQFAHNTLVVDGASIPRAGGDMEQVSMRAERVDADGFTVTGRNARLVDAVHERTFEVRETSGQPQIDILDTVVCDRLRTYELLWNLGPEVQPVLHGHGFELFRDGTKVMDAYFEADVPLRVTVHRGQKSPTYLGWRFPKFGEAEAADVVRVAFAGTTVRVKTAIRLADFTYKERGIADPLSEWQRWTGKPGEVGLNYCQVPARTAMGSRQLVVVFTAVHQPGDFTYNYRATVDQTGHHALYVLDDFGDQGAYYLQDHGDRGIFDSVQALIAAKLDELGLSPTDLVTIGSSKGGAAALIHGLAAGAGHVFVGAPQTRIGTFVSRPHPNILRLMTGGTQERHVRELDEALYRLAEISVGPPDAGGHGAGTTSVTIVVGDADHHYRNHVLPFVAHLKELGNNPSLIVLPGLKHADIGAAYKTYLLEFLRAIESVAGGEGEDAAASTKTSELAVLATARDRSVTASILRGSGDAFAGHLYRERELVGKIPYSSGMSMTWSGLPSGRYRVRIFARSNKGQAPTPQTTAWVDVP